jgi:hypothetical protein
VRSIQGLQSALVIGILVAAAAQADTVATFADTSPDPVFTVGTDMLSGKADGLTLQAPLTGDRFEDVSFSMADLSLTGQRASAGSIEFRSKTDDLLLRIEFDNATFASAPAAFGAGSQSGDNVRFSGLIVPADLMLENEQFSFGLSSPTLTTSGITYTAAFSSSATIVDAGSGDGGLTDGSGSDGSGTGGGTTDGSGSDGSGTGGGTTDGSGVTDGGGTTDGGTTDGGTTDGGSSAGDGSGEGSGGQQGDAVSDDMLAETGCAPMCAMGMLPMVPWMFLGLGVMKLRGRFRA